MGSSKPDYSTPIYLPSMVIIANSSIALYGGPLNQQWTFSSRWWSDAIFVVISSLFIPHHSKILLLLARQALSRHYTIKWTNGIGIANRKLHASLVTIHGYVHYLYDNVIVTQSDYLLWEDGANKIDYLSSNSGQPKRSLL